MRDIDDLRHALAAETADLAVHLPPETIRHRARRLQVRRSAGIAAAGALAVVALAMPTVLLNGGSGSGYQAAGPMPGRSSCPTQSAGDRDGGITWLGPLVETGVILDAPNVDTRYDVLLGLLDAPLYASPGSDQQKPGYGFVIAFRDRKTGTVQNWDMLALGRDPNGDFPARGEPGHQFQSSQLTLGPNNVLDVGLYSRAAHRITVASEGRATGAQTAQNAATGWTFFWVQRDAAPLPEGHDTTSVEYTGPERLTITAYDAAGNVQHTVTGGFHIGHHVQNPRDHQPVQESTAPATTPAVNTAPACAPASTSK